ncbi:MAG: imidazole glycerol phosphate synthase subunit HisH [Xanthomonadales bacterium]|nr:imidazole glycerol phosphate synthase subunit HisH [Xanthomonadales bacterium]NIX13923.1 imidazole glycerol phosphate synthase subunit HisH [Xanthomonadales bacterium]
MIAIVNYGLGNLHSVQKATAHVGGEAVVTEIPQVILNAEKVILPGVGAFADGMRGLRSRGLAEVVQEAAALGKPLLGICLGMQLLFEESDEQGQHEGLGLLPGKVVQFRHPGIKVPQIGWNQLEVVKPSGLMNSIQDGDYVYFNHSYYCIPEETADVLTRTDYGVRFASSVARDNILGVQFHPEKSQAVGLTILKNFVEL